MRLAAPGMSERAAGASRMNALRIISRTKLYWGLAIICLIGALASPHTSSGRNIFLSYNNLTDVLRQVSITGLVATGMTIVILLGGIDLSVGSVMGCSTIVCAMLLTQPGWTPAAIMGVPAATIAIGLAVGLSGAVRVQRTGARARRRRRTAPGDRAGPLARLSHSWASRSCGRRRGRRVHRLAGSDEIRGFGGSPGDAVLCADARIDQRRPHRQGTASALHRDAGDDGQRARHRPAHGRPGQRGHRRLHGHERHGGVRDSALDGLGPRSDAEHLLSRRHHRVRRNSALHHLRPLRLCDRRQRGSGEAFRHQGRAGPVRRLCHFMPAGWSSQAFFSSRSIGRENRTRAPASNSTRSPPSSSAGRA